ncbi:hypothetical protein GCM10027341_12500 [Spirosoma knui]
MGSCSIYRLKSGRNLAGALNKHYLIYTKLYNNFPNTLLYILLLNQQARKWQTDDIKKAFTQQNVLVYLLTLLHLSEKQAI